MVDGGRVTSQVKALGDHRFRAVFVPHDSGPHAVDMTFNGLPVPGRAKLFIITYVYVYSLYTIINTVVPHGLYLVCKYGVTLDLKKKHWHNQEQITVFHCPIFCRACKVRPLMFECLKFVSKLSAFLIYTSFYALRISTVFAVEHQFEHPCTLK